MRLKLLIVLLFIMILEQTKGQRRPVAQKSTSIFNIDSLLHKEIVYPEEAGNKGMSCLVTVIIWISGKGQIETLEILNQEGSVFGNEVKRVIKLSEGKWPKDGVEKHIMLQVVFEQEISGTENIQLAPFDMFVIGRANPDLFKVPYILRGPVIIMRYVGGKEIH